MSRPIVHVLHDSPMDVWDDIATDYPEIVTMSEQKQDPVNLDDHPGWVIEGAWSSAATPDYWLGSSAWSADHNCALRFARREDAQNAADLMLSGVAVRICEHVWVNT